MNEQSKHYFVKLLDYLEQKKVNIEFFFCPLAPTLWDRIYNGEYAENYYIHKEIDTFARNLAMERNIKTTGAYNPHIVGIKDEDFWDSRHIRHDLLSVYFDFRKN